MKYCDIVLYYRMILFSNTCIFGILTFVATSQALQVLNNNEISLPFSNEQSTQYKYEKTIQSATTKNEKISSPDQFSSPFEIQQTLPDGNTNDLLSGGDTGLNTQPNIDELHQTADQTLMGAKYSSMISKTNGLSNYAMGYKLYNTDVVSNDNLLNTKDRYIFDNDNFNDTVNNPLSNKNDIYKYVDVEGLNNDYGIQNDDKNNNNLQGSPYNSYAPNLNARYENSQLPYALNQNSPSFKVNTFKGNVLYPYDTNVDRYNIPKMPVMNFDYDNNINNIEIDESSPEDDQLSRTDGTFYNTQIPLTTDDYLDRDLTSNRIDYNLDNGGNINIELADSNYIDQVNENENDFYNDQDFIQYNMQPISVPDYKQTFGDYTSSLNTRTNGDINYPEGIDQTPEILNSEHNFLTDSDLNKQGGSNLNTQNYDLNSLPIDNVQLYGYRYSKTDTLNISYLIEGSDGYNSNSSSIKAFVNHLNSTQTTVSRKNNSLVDQNVYDAKGQVIGKIYKPFNSTGKNNNQPKYNDSSSSSSRSSSSSSSSSSSDDGEFSDDIHAIKNNIKRAAHDTVGNIHDTIKDIYNTTKAVGKSIGNTVGNATSKAADGVEQMAKTAYHGSKNAVKAVGNAVDDAVDTVGNTAKTAYNVSKSAAKAAGNAISTAADSIENTAGYFY